MNPNIFSLINIGIDTMFDMQKQQKINEIRNRILWRNSFSMPRKKKKRIRKEILLDRAMNEYFKTLINPLTGI